MDSDGTGSRMMRSRALSTHLQVRHHHPEHFLLGDEPFLAADPWLDARVDSPECPVLP